MPVRVRARRGKRPGEVVAVVVSTGLVRIKLERLKDRGKVREFVVQFSSKKGSVNFAERISEKRLLKLLEKLDRMHKAVGIVRSFVYGKSPVRR